MALIVASSVGAGVAGTEAAAPKLLEPERAFAFSVQAVDERTVEARFTIASGYYLYREKLKFSVEPTPLTAAPVLPAGKIKEDEFFGKVETYRGQIAVPLALASAEPGRKVTVRAESQGCADAGVCYPPQVQSVTVTLPLPGARPGAPVAAVPARKSWFN
ncbi:MAG: protein-disulfide reductase DsbD N-terminal domain-containing protein [Betaproteobacteria bacterium]